MELSFSELKDLLIGTAAPEHFPSPFVGQVVLVRSNMAGVHMGECVAHEGTTVVLKNSYRLYSWVAKQGIALSGVAAFGVKDSKIDTAVPLHFVADVVELLACTEAAYKSVQK